MKRLILFLTSFVLMTHSAFAQKLDWEEYDPPSTLVVPENPVTRAKFPFIDVHGHQYRMSEQDLGPVVAAMDTLNLQVMVNLSGRSGEVLKKALENANTNYPGRFVVFANVDFSQVGSPNWTENAVAQLEADGTYPAATAPEASAGEQPPIGSRLL